MNKRIQELYKQAWGHFPCPTGEPELEKFALLIVQECIDIAQDRANFPGFPPNDVNDIIDEIREHFGVENEKV